jgi:hypothetical protein
MNVDSYFEIGHSHKVCEDYALSGVQDDLAYAIVSDGCSSSKDSDVGARLLAHISRDALLYLHRRKLLYDPNFLESSFRATFEEIVIKKCLEVKDTLRFPCDIFDATLLMTAVVGDTWKRKILFSWGDGYFILKRPSGAVDVISLSYESNAPYYLSYELSQDKHDAYATEYGSVPLHKNIDRISVDGVVDFVDVDVILTVMQRSYFSVMGEGTDVTQIIVASDGIGTYEDDTRIPIYPPGTEHMKYTALNVIPQIVSYKNPVGEFVTRRMNRLKKEYADTHVIHQDDVSCAAINLV